MRGTVAKRIRREVYGTDFSPRARTYFPIKTNRYHLVKDLNTGLPIFPEVRIPHVTLQNTGLRRVYLLLKKEVR